MITQRIKTKDEESALAFSQTLINAVGQDAIDNGLVEISILDDDKSQIAFVILPKVNAQNNTVMSLDITGMNIVPRPTEDAGESADAPAEPELETAPDLPATDAAPEVERIDAGDMDAKPVEHVDAELVSEPKH